METFANVRVLKTILLLACLIIPASARPWTDDVMYFVMTDRFHDGDPENNTPAGCDPALYDPHQKDISRYFGGDLRGLENAIQAGYFNDLGITALWLLPFYPSPLKDDGYDTADYFGVHPMYGTLADFKTFLREAHQRGLRVITELVMNHTSDQHPWFQRARRAKPGSDQSAFAAD